MRYSNKDIRSNNKKYMNIYLGVEPAHLLSVLSKKNCEDEGAAYELFIIISSEYINSKTT